MRLCKKCSTEKPLEEFHRDASKPLGRHYYCKECAKEYYQKWQDQKPETRARYLVWKKQKQAEAREFLVGYLQKHSCVDCGQNDIRVLVFDHVSGTKINGVFTIASRGNSLKLIEDEIKKCEVRCYNCHAIVTAQRGNWWLSKLGEVPER